MPTPEASPRYRDLGPLGRGGMSEVRRVRDRNLRRVSAMKILHSDLLVHPQFLARFVEEAQATAQLDHPGVVPVYDLGRLGDGRPYYTMKEIRGRTLTAVIEKVHAARQGDRWEVTQAGWSLQRLVDAFRTVCDAVSYAHARGMIHRDLKPDNVMIGEFGEVHVVDWGLVKMVGSIRHSDEAVPVSTVRSDAAESDVSMQTMAGSVAGTPAYMAPEQAAGELERLGPPTDVYSLGAILYEILSGHAPYSGSGESVVRQVVAGPPPPPARVAGEEQPYGTPVVPAELRRICLKAMSREMDDRYVHAGKLARAVGEWLDGSVAREQALGQVARAREMEPEIRRLRAEAAQLRASAEEKLRGCEPSDPASTKAPGWADEDRAEEIEREAELNEVRLTRMLQSALSLSADLPEAHELLADHYQRRHVAAEAARDHNAAARLELLLRAHDQGRHRAYLDGEGALTLVTDPPAEVVLFRYELENRRLVPRVRGSLGTTPLRTVSLPMGSYLCEIRDPNRPVVRYPVHIGRGEHWDGVPPGESEPFPIRLPEASEIGSGAVYVPAGWFVAGGDPGASNGMDEVRVWCDGFLMQSLPVTNLEYIRFLDDLVDQGREAEALEHAARERQGKFEEQGELIFGRDGRGHFLLVPDADGDLWLPEWGTMMVAWHGAKEYSRWLSKRLGLEWRIPFELEWEKAARGVDGRIFPWGDFLDPSWCCIRSSHAHALAPTPVGTFAGDVSVYGVRDLAGGMKDWCEDPWGPEFPLIESQRVVRRFIQSSPLRCFRGGAWNGSEDHARIGRRDSANPTVRTSYTSFRLVRSLD